MRRLVVVVFLVIAVFLTYRTFGGEETGTGNLTLAAPEPNIGSSVSNFVARDTKGRNFELTDDGVYVLAFWSPLNQNSNQARQGFLRVAREYHEEASFAVVYVNGARTDEEAPYERLHDPRGTLASRYNVKRVPRLFVIRDGIVTWTLGENQPYDGYARDLEQKVAEAIEDEQTGEPQAAIIEQD